MGSATTQALGELARAVGTQTVDLGTARELFSAARAVAETPALSGALADPSAPVDARATVVSRVFQSFSPAAQHLLTAVVSARWSNAAELVDGVEELAIRVAAKAEPADVSAELFEVSRLVSGNAELELALGSRLGDRAAKGTLVRSLLEGRLSAGTVLIVASLVEQPGERRVRTLLRRALRIAAAERGRTVATVHTASRLSPAQAERLAAALSRSYGEDVSLNQVVDPAVVGGIRVQIADDVIDGSVSARLAELRQRLAG